MTTLLAEFPQEWRVGVTVARPPDRDRHGDPVPGTGSTHTVADADGAPICLLAPRSTTDPVDRSDLITTNAVLYAPVIADIRRGDELTITGHPLHAGRWRVDGAPQPWPLGLEIAVIRED